MKSKLRTYLRYGRKEMRKREKGMAGCTLFLMSCFRNDFTHCVIPDLIRNPVFSIWIPAFAGMTALRSL